jgi:pimeloyl-ACP methyl ester carboxylesterase
LTYNQQSGFGRVRKYLNIEHGPDSRNSAGRHDGIFGAHQERIFAGFRELTALSAEHGHGKPYWALPPSIRIRFRDTVMALFRRALNRPLSRRVVELAARYAERLLTRYLMPVERWQVYLQVMESFMEGGDTRAALPNITVPTTVMIGRHSRYFQMEAQLEMAAQIPNAQAVVFENSGHVPIVDQPVRFQREFSRFLLS